VLARERPPGVRPRRGARVPSRPPRRELRPVGSRRDSRGRCGRLRRRLGVTSSLSREEYAARYGPTLGDRIRLADTDLWIRVERDDVGYGDEPLWGYAKNIRSRMTQFDQASVESELDVLVAGVVVVD